MFSLSNCGLKIKNERPLLCVVSGSVNRQMHRLGDKNGELNQMDSNIVVHLSHLYLWKIRKGPTPLLADQAAGHRGRLGHWVAGSLAGAGGRASALAKPTSSTEGCGI